jgi:hypothetical protein
LQPGAGVKKGRPAFAELTNVGGGGAAEGKVRFFFFSCALL